MKTTTKIISVLALILCGMMLVSCGITDKIAPKDTWYEKDVEYSGTTIKCYIYYSDTGCTDKELRDDVTIGDGLTVLITPDGMDSSLVSSLFGGSNLFVIKNLSKTTPTTLKGKDREYDFTMNDALWSALYLAELGTDSKKNSLPSYLRSDVKNSFTPVTSAEDLKGSLDIEELLLKLLLKYLSSK